MAVQWLGLHAPSVGGMGSLPGQGTKIPQALWRGQIIIIIIIIIIILRRRNHSSQILRSPDPQWLPCWPIVGWGVGRLARRAARLGLTFIMGLKFRLLTLFPNRIIYTVTERP